jgi:uncharacterized protein YdcH (DUF465 family)
MSDDENNNNREVETKIPECICKECAERLSQIKDVNTHFTKMYASINSFNESIQTQNETLTKIFKEMIPLLKNIDARLKQNHTILEKLSQ